MEKIILSKKNLVIKRGGIFKFVFFKYCWEENKFFSILCSCSFLFLAFLIPLITYFSCLNLQETKEESTIMFLRAYIVIFPQVYVIPLIFLIILFGWTLTNIVNRGDLGWILATSTSRKQVFFTFVFQFFIVFFSVFFILLIPSFFIFNGEKPIVSLVDNPLSGEKGFSELDPDTWVFKHKTFNVPSYYFYFSVLQHFVIGVIFIAISIFFASLFNTSAKYFLYCGGIYTFFFVFYILHEVGKVYEGISWMTYFNNFTVLSLCWNGYFLYIGNLSRVFSPYYPPLKGSTHEVVVGNFDVNKSHIFMVDSILLVFCVGVILGSYYIFKKKDLPL